METEANISFAGCGFLGVYHIGVSACLKKFAPHLLQNKIGGSSAGAMCAVALVCDIPLEDITRKVLILASQSRKLILGPFNPSFNIHQITKDTLDKSLQQDQHSYKWISWQIWCHWCFVCNIICAWNVRIYSSQVQRTLCH